jgi:type I restriction enzyme S subunit
MLRIPLVPEQRAIAAVLSAADDEIKALEAECAALERQKKGLMQKLLTGEVRVKPNEFQGKAKL